MLNHRCISTGERYTHLLFVEIKTMPRIKKKRCMLNYKRDDWAALVDKQTVCNIIVAITVALDHN